jgi:hypothetical protein
MTDIIMKYQYVKVNRLLYKLIPESPLNVVLKFVAAEMLSWGVNCSFYAMPEICLSSLIALEV